MANSITKPPEASRARTFALTIAYDGTAYSGWQVQPDRKTIQGELERVIRPLMGPAELDLPCRVLGSGRTDAGVHAIGQVARCVMPNWNADAASLLKAINSRLPDDIVVVNAREMTRYFHPIADAISKRYRYQVQLGGNRDPFRHRTWHRVNFSIEPRLLEQAASRFIGRHDFAAFQAAGSNIDSTVRTITTSRWIATDAETAASVEGQQWTYEVQGNGFLYNMVRNLVGTMVEVARGKRPVSWIDEVIASRDRNQAGPTVPPHGLFLCQVDYPDAIFQS